MKKLLSALLICTIALTTQAQLSWQKSQKSESRKDARHAAFRQIRQLRHGALLVQLSSKITTVQALRKSGDERRAGIVVEQQHDYNMAVVKAFRGYFDFCPVFFYFSENARSVQEKQFGGNIFLNDSLQPDQGIQFPGSDFLIATAGSVEQDTTKKFESYYYVQGPNGPERRATYYASPALGFSALILKSDQSVQLRRPFPFYARIYESLPFQEEMGVVVKKMERKLLRFYKRSMKKRNLSK